MTFPSHTTAQRTARGVALAAAAVMAVALAPTAPALAQVGLYDIETTCPDGAAFHPSKGCAPGRWVKPKKRHHDHDDAKDQNKEGRLSRGGDIDPEASCPPSPRMVITVEPKPVATPCSYTSLFEALSRAEEGARIVMKPGVYVEPFLEVNRSVTIEGLGPYNSVVIETADPRGCLAFTPPLTTNAPSLFIEGVEFRPLNGGACLRNEAGFMRLERVGIDLRGLPNATGVYGVGGETELANVIIRGDSVGYVNYTSEGVPTGSFVAVDWNAAASTMSAARWNASAGPGPVRSPVQAPNDDAARSHDMVWERAPAFTHAGVYDPDPNAMKKSAWVQGRIGERRLQPWRPLGDCASGGVGVCIGVEATGTLRDVLVSGVYTGVRAVGSTDILDDTSLVNNGVGLEVLARHDAPFADSPTHQITSAGIGQNEVGVMVSKGFDGALAMNRTEVRGNYLRGLFMADVSSTMTCAISTSALFKQNADGAPPTGASYTAFESWAQSQIGSSARFAINRNNYLLTSQAKDECGLPRSWTRFMNQVRGRDGNEKPGF